MAVNDSSDIRIALARSIAHGELPDDTIDTLAKQIASTRYQIRGIDICAYGICLDYIFEGHDWWKEIPELVRVDGGILKGIEIFPLGIPYPDFFRVRVTQSMDLLPQMRR